MTALPPAVHPWPIGPGPRYRPVAASGAVQRGAQVGGLRCASGARFQVHVELFANRRVIVVPAGIGVARSGCRYPVSTSAPTGVVSVLRGRRLSLGDLFAVWSRRLGPRRLLSFTGPVRLYLDGRRQSGRPAALRLTPHAEIVVELGAYLAPHPAYVFPKEG